MFESFALFSLADSTVLLVYLFLSTEMLSSTLYMPLHNPVGLSSSSARKSITELSGLIFGLHFHTEKL